MRTATAIVTVLLSVAITTGGNAASSAATRADQSITQYLTGPVEQGKSPGIFAAIMDDKGIRSIGVAGVRKQGSDAKITVDDLFHIGSNTKAMTSVLLAGLVADGVFPNGWRTTIAEVFPELVGEIHSDYESVSLDELVRMRSGMPKHASWGAYGYNEMITRRYRIVKERLEDSPEVSRGEFKYSNVSYLMAGAMAERLTGKTWEDLMEERLFKPLGMTRAGFGAPGAAHRLDQPWGHRRSGSGDWRARHIDNPAAAGPAGTVHLPIGDYAKFLRLWYRGTAPALLDRDTLDYLMTPHSGKYAAGWRVLKRRWGGGTVLAHGGSNTYWNVTVWVAPKLGRAYLAGANSSEPGTRRMLDGIIWKLINH